MIENPRTGEQVDFVAESPESLVMDVTWSRPGHRALEHVHPAMEERFRIVSGQAGFLIDGHETSAAPGDVVIVPAGVRHLAWNAGEEPVHLRIDMTPALRWREFTTRLFAGEDPAHLLQEFAPEVTLPS